MALSSQIFPGLIEGASEGVGLGHEFLRHIERTRVIIHIVDAASTEGRDPVDDIYKINKELEAYNPEIASRPAGDRSQQNRLYFYRRWGRKPH